MTIDTRPLAPTPFEGIDLPSFTLTSSTLTDDAPMPESATARAGSLSPDLTWEGFPERTASFMLTCFDPDAPIPSGWWHWTNPISIPPQPENRDISFIYPPELCVCMSL